MKNIIHILLFLSLSVTVYSQNNNAEIESKKVELFFNHDSCDIDSAYMNNGEPIKKLTTQIKINLVDPNADLKEVVVESYSSPDGDLRGNKKLSEDRTNATYTYLIDDLAIPDSLIVVKNHGIAWDLMREYVIDSDMPYKNEVVDIIDNIPAETWKRVDANHRWHTLVDSRNKHLMELKYGEPYRYMLSSIFPYLRKSSIEIIWNHNKPTPTPQIKVDSLITPEPKAILEIKNSIITEPTVEVIEPEKEKLPRNPILAIKTNFVGLGMGVANVAVEYPFKDHFSVDGSAYYSPYTISNDWRIRLAMLQPEFRYWLSSPLEKHFFGLHAHIGLFNISTNQWRRYQNSADQPLWGFGLSYGYALYLNRALSLEFTLGAGYASLRYDSFYNVDNGAMYDHTERGYWGLTKAGITLNYIINRK